MRRRVFTNCSRAFVFPSRAVRRSCWNVRGEPMFTNVIVPLDGRGEATAALSVARTLAAPGGARISLLRVVHRPAGLFGDHAAEVRDAAAYLDEVVRDRLRVVDLPV